ncbi:MAG: preprotein translocase subunit SecE [Patescibacteria group bacterium]
MKTIIKYLKNTKAELRHVNWPTKTQAINYTVLVIIIALIVAFYLGFLDYIFMRIINILFS